MSGESSSPFVSCSPGAKKIYGGQVQEKKKGVLAHELASAALHARSYGTPLKTAFIC